MIFKAYNEHERDAFLKINTRCTQVLILHRVPKLDGSSYILDLALHGSFMIHFDFSFDFLD